MSSYLNKDFPVFVRKVLANPKLLHDSAKIYNRSQVKQLVNRWVLWWALDNPATEWCCDQVIGVQTTKDDTKVFFKLGFPRYLESTLFYIISES